MGRTSPATKFLLAAGAGALNTANAVRPLSRDGGLSMPSCLAGWLTSELPLHTIAGQAAATAAVGARHGFRSPQARAALTLNAASWAALATMHRSAGRAYEVFDEALAEVFDPEELAPAPMVKLTAAQIANPLANGRSRYLRAEDVKYSDEAGRRNHLDVWAPPNLPGGAKAPVLLQIHGGGWTIGNKEQQGRPLMTQMCSQGWICVAINYRLSPRSTWPDHIVDVKKAIAWIRSHITGYGGDPDFVAVTGGSAGGHLTSLAALSPNDPSFQPGFEDVDTTLQAAVPFYGVYDPQNRDGTGRDDIGDFMERIVLKCSPAEHPDVWDAASPAARDLGDAPPFLVVHGTNDSLVPYQQARSFVAQLRAASRRPVVYAELPGAQHAFEIFASVRTHHTVRAVGRFLDHVHSSHTTPMAVSDYCPRPVSQE